MKCAEKNHADQSVFLSLEFWEGWQTLMGFSSSPPMPFILMPFYSVDLKSTGSLKQSSFLTEQSCVLVSPLGWGKTSLCRLHEGKLLGKNWNPLCQWCNSLDFSDSKEFGYSITFYEVVVKIPVIIVWRNQFKALCFFGKVLSPLDLIFLGLSMWAGYHATGAFVCFGNTRFLFLQFTDWMKLPSAIKEIWHNKQKIIPVHIFLLWTWNKGIKWEMFVDTAALSPYFHVLFRKRKLLD